jgi:peptidoglycan/LPS O-acetylase OafA/YrhL
LKRIPSLDGLRALSIVLVLIGHGTSQPGLGYNRVLMSYARFGVQVFFVLSGFLITTLIIEEREKTGRISLRDFYRRRFFRIVPPAFAYTFIVTLTCWHWLSLPDVICAWTYTVDFLPHSHVIISHLWSLSVEEQFYLLWPAVLILFWKYRVRAALTAIILAPLFRVFFYLVKLEVLAHTALPATLDTIAWGCLLALCRDRLNVRLIDRFMVPITVATLLSPVVFMPHQWDPVIWQPMINPTVTNIGLALVIEHCVRKEHRFLNWRPVAWFGTISYSLYLWQQPFMFTWWRHAWTSFPLNVVIAFACALSSHLLIERPFLSLRRRLEHRLPAREECSRAIQSPQLIQDS